MQIIVNGTAREVVASMTVAALVPGEGRGVAVAVNGEVVPRTLLAQHRLTEGDVVEVVTAVQGG